MHYNGIKPHEITRACKYSTKLIGMVSIRILDFFYSTPFTKFFEPNFWLRLLHTHVYGVLSAYNVYS